MDVGTNNLDNTLSIVHSVIIFILFYEIFMQIASESFVLEIRNIKLNTHVHLSTMAMNIHTLDNILRIPHVEAMFLLLFTLMLIPPETCLLKTLNFT